MWIKKPVFLLLISSIGQLSVAQTYYLRSDLAEPLDWDNGTHWTLALDGTTPVGSIPNNSIDVILNRAVAVDANGQSANTTTIQANGILIVDETSGTPTSGHNFGTVSGTGTLRMISEDATSPIFPGGTWTTFLRVGGGTVEYSGDGSYTLPTQATYNNLTITATTTTTTKTLPSANVDLVGDFTVAELSNLISTTVNANSGSHTLNIEGSIFCDGAIDFDISVGNEVDVTFDGTGNASISGNGTVELHRLILNKDVQSTTLTVNVDNFSIGDEGAGVTSTSIDLQVGTLDVLTDGTITLSSNGDFSIPSTAGLSLNSSGLLLQTTGTGGGDLQLSGSLSIVNGVLSVAGDESTTTLSSDVLYSGLSASFNISGGSLEVKGAFRPLDGSNDVIAFNQTGGVVSLARRVVTTELRMGTSARAVDADFSINDSRSSFQMSGGTLEIVRAKGGDGKALAISSVVVPDANVTGGEVRIVRDATDGAVANTGGSSMTTVSEVAIYSTVPFWNLSIGDGDYTGQIGGANLPGNGSVPSADINVFNNLAINIEDADGGGEGEFHFFHVGESTSDNANGFDLKVGGNLTITNGTLLTTDDDLSGSIELNGAGSQAINGEPFEYLTINKPTGDLTMTSPLIVEHVTIDDFPGNIDMGGFGLTLSGNWINNDTDDLYTVTNPGTFSFNSGSSQTISGNNNFGPITISNNTTVNVGMDSLRTTTAIAEMGSGTFLGPTSTLIIAGNQNITPSSLVSVSSLILEMTSSGLILDNDPEVISFNNLNIHTGIYDGQDLNVLGDLTIGAAGAVDLTGISTIDVDGDFSNASTLDLAAAGITEMSLSGHFSNSGTFNSPNLITFDASTAQTLSSALSATNFTRSGGGTLTLEADLSISGVLTLSHGHIASSALNLVTLGSGASIAGGSNGSHVSTAVAHTIASTSQTTKIFPLGDGSNYRPIELTLTQTTATSTTYTGQIIAGSPPARTYPVGVAQVSTIRYYEILQNPVTTLSSDAGANSIAITYGSEDKVGDENSLKIVNESGGSSWADLGASLSMGSDAASGAISSSNDFNSLGDFALASELSGVLPVEMLYFKVIPDNQALWLKWATGSELDNDFFEVLWSVNGFDFQKIGQVKGRGHSDELVEYSFLVKRPSPGLNYFRIRQVDFDGKVEYFNTVRHDWFPDRSIKIFPNPVKDKLFISGLEELESLHFILHDLNGRPLINGKLKNPVIDMGILKPGLYLIYLQGPSFQTKESVLKLTE